MGVSIYSRKSGQALNPARPTSLKTVQARPKIRPGQKDVKSRRQLIKGDWRRLLRSYVCAADSVLQSISFLLHWA